MKYGFKRFAAIITLLVFCFGLTAPAFAEGLSVSPADLSEGTESLYEDNTALLDSAQTAGEALVCVSDEGAALLPVQLADTDIVFNTMMDVTEGAENLSAAKRKAIFGSSVAPDGCRILAAQSPTIDTESLIALLESCEGVYFVEANEVVTLNDITPEESADNTEEENLPESSTTEETADQNTEASKGETLQDQSEISEEEKTDTENTDLTVSSVPENLEAAVQNINIEIPETGGASKSDMTVVQWALENLGKVFNGKAGVDVNLRGSRTKNKTVICVMDTGIDYLHEDLNDRMIDLSEDCYTNAAGEQIMDATGCGKYGYNTLNAADHSDPMDYYDHGTHCAGIIAGEGNSVSEGETPGTSGVMDKAALVAVKLSDGRTISSLNVLEGLQWVLRAKTEFGVNIAACNFSLGGNWTYYTRQLAMAQLDTADVTFCMSSGNESINIDTTEHSTAAGADSALVVDALTPSGTCAQFSNYGNYTDLFAPGSMIYSTVNEYTGLKETGAYVNATPVFDGAAYGEAKQTLAYAGFDGNGKDTLTFHEVTTLENSHTSVSTEYYKSGGQSLQIDGIDGSVVLESDSIDLSGSVQKGDDLYFDMSAYSDLKNSEASLSTYTQIAFKVKYKSDTEEGKTGYETYAVQYGIYSTDLPWYGYLKSGDDFEKYRTSLGKTGTANVKTVLSLCQDAVTFDEWINRHAGEWEIDYSDFQIRLECGTFNNMRSDGTIDTNKGFKVPFCIDGIAIGSQAGYYDYMSGTSMAAPAVTGVYGLVYSHYGKENLRDTHYECNDKISARIKGSVTTNFNDGSSMELDQYCITGGVVNASAALSKDESSFNPVIQSASVRGDVLTLKGWFLGKEGSITIGGQPAEILSWQQDKNEAVDDPENAGSIMVQIPDAISGEQVIAVTNAAGKTGRFYTDCSRITTDYEDLTLPEIFYNETEGSLTEIQRLGVLNGMPALYGLTTNNTQTLYIYNRETGSWQAVSFVDAAIPAADINGFFEAKGQLYALFPTYDDYSFINGQRLCRLDMNNEGLADWTTVLTMDQRKKSTLAVSEDQLYLIGGSTLAGSSVNTVDKIVFAEDGSCSLETWMDTGSVSINSSFQTAAKDGSIYALNLDKDFYRIDLKEKTVTSLPMPDIDADATFFTFSETPSGFILNTHFKTVEASADTWFFNTATETWQASDLVLDTALTYAFCSVTTGNKVYVLGKSRNGSYWFFRALGFTASGVSVDWIKGSGEDAVFTVPVSKDDLTGVPITLDGQALSEGEDYTLFGEEGQTVLVLKNALLEEQALGRHDLVLTYNISGRDLAVTCTLKVLEAQADDPSISPDQTETNVSTGITGDSLTGLWIAVLLLAAAGAAFILITKGKTKV